MKNVWVKAFLHRVPVLFLLIGQISLANVPADVKSISSKVIDLGRPHNLYMVYGMATAVILPEGISSAIPGNSISLKIERKGPENLLALWLSGKHVPPTNLIVLSGNSRVVFYVIPNTKTHQNTLEIVGTYGGASFEDDDAKLIYSGKL